MSIEVVSRPYAKALFEIAQAQNKLAQWQVFLQVLAFVTEQAEVKAVLTVPNLAQDKKSAFLLKVCKEFAPKGADNFVSLLLRRSRIFAVSMMYKQFCMYKLEAEGAIEAKITLAFATAEQVKQQLVKALEQRLKKKVIPEFIEDPSILGGAIIEAGNRVIDGSVKGKLKGLSEVLGY